MRKEITKYIGDDVLVITLRYDDHCNNGYKDFAITADLYDRSTSNPMFNSSIRNNKGKRRYLGSCGCLHDEIRKHAPELAHLVDWHLMSEKGPLHYIANTLYHAEQGNLEAAKKSAIWPNATLEQLSCEDTLNERLPELVWYFKRLIEFTFKDCK